MSAILNSIQCDNNNDSNNNNSSFFLVFFYISFCYFFWFICLFQRSMPTNICIVYFSIDRWSDGKIWKIWFSILKIGIKRLNNKVTQVAGLISWWPERHLWEFKYSNFCSGFSAELVSFHHTQLWIYLFCLFFLFVYAVHVISLGLSILDDNDEGNSIIKKDNNDAEAATRGIKKRYS